MRKKNTFPLRCSNTCLTLVASDRCSGFLTQMAASPTGLGLCNFLSVFTRASILFQPECPLVYNLFCLLGTPSCSDLVSSRLATQLPCWAPPCCNYQREKHLPWSSTSPSSWFTHLSGKHLQVTSYERVFKRSIFWVFCRTLFYSNTLLIFSLKTEFYGVCK